MPPLLLLLLQVTFSTVLTMPSMFLSRLVRDMQGVGEFVTIRSENNSFIMSVKGDYATQETVVGEQTGDSGMSIARSDELVEGVFSLKYLNLFCRAAALSNTVEIYCRSHYPLILVFSVASLGSLRFALAPKHED